MAEVHFGKGQGSGPVWIVTRVAGGDSGRKRIVPGILQNNDKHQMK